MEYIQEEDYIQGLAAVCRETAGSGQGQQGTGPRLLQQTLTGRCMHGAGLGAPHKGDTSPVPARVWQLVPGGRQRGLRDPGCGDVGGMPTPPKGSLNTTGSSKLREASCPSRFGRLQLFWNRTIDWSRKQADGKGNSSASWKWTGVSTRSQAARMRSQKVILLQRPKAHVDGWDRGS